MLCLRLRLRLRCFAFAFAFALALRLLCVALYLRLRFVVCTTSCSCSFPSMACPPRAFRSCATRAPARLCLVGWFSVFASCCLSGVGWCVQTHFHPPPEFCVILSPSKAAHAGVLFALVRIRLSGLIFEGLLLVESSYQGVVIGVYPWSNQVIRVWCNILARHPLHSVHKLAVILPH